MSIPCFFYCQPLIRKIEMRIDEIYQALLLKLLIRDFNDLNYRLQDQTYDIYVKYENEPSLTLKEFVQQYIIPIRKQEWVDLFIEDMCASRNVYRIPYVNRDPFREDTPFRDDIEDICMETSDMIQYETNRTSEHVSDECEMYWKLFEEKLSNYRKAQKLKKD